MKPGLDDVIDTLIRPPRPIFVGFDWSQTDKLRPTGDAQREAVLAATLQPVTGLR